MKIVIIGAKGMLGQELVKTFADHEVLAWDKDDCDITNQDEVERMIVAEQPDLIINSAAYNDVDGAETNKDTAYLLNGYAVGYLAQATKKIGAFMIHYSTDYVFRGDKKQGYGEDDQPDPVSAYGKSKFLGERELIKHTDRYYLIRLSKLFGNAANIQGAKKSFVDKMLELAETRKELDVVDEELSSPTYAPDLAKRTRELLEDNYNFGVYHGANSGACTWYGFAQEIFKIKGIDIELNPVPGNRFPRPATRPMYSILLNTKLPAARSWQEALNDYLK